MFAKSDDWAASAARKRARDPGSGFGADREACFASAIARHLSFNDRLSALQILSQAKPMTGTLFCIISSSFYSCGSLVASWIFTVLSRVVLF